MRDQTEHPQAELARLRAENAVLRETLDAIDGGVVVYDRDRRYRFGNSQYHATFPHLPPDDRLIGRLYEEVLGLSIDAGSVKDPQAYIDRAAFVARRAAELLDRSQPQSEERHYPQTNRWSIVRVRWTPTGNLVALQVDITELKRLQQELLRAQRMETIGRISGGVAHDFNNLLTVIISNLEMLCDRLDDPERQKLAASALAAAESGSRLIRQLLTFARRDVTRARVHGPNLLLAGMRDLLQRAIGPEIGFALDLDPALPAVSLDASQFEAAVINLVLNARHAVLESGRPGRITIATRLEPGPGEGTVAVVVSDTGCGMPPEVAVQAFEPFFTTRAPGGGSGLGLAQVWGFAAGAGGSASIESAPGQGTSVSIRLPASGAAPTEARAAAPVPPPPPPPGRRILVVEDDEAVLMSTEMILRGLGYVVLVAPGAEEAVRLLHDAGRIDVLFSDIAMPGDMDGLDLAATARACRPDIKVLLTSGYPAGALGPDADELRGIELLPKPYRRADLQARLRLLLAE